MIEKEYIERKKGLEIEINIKGIKQSSFLNQLDYKKKLTCKPRKDIRMISKKKWGGNMYFYCKKTLKKNA